MKAVVKIARGPGHVELIDVDVPEPGSGEVLLEVDSCGICGTDLHVRNDTFRNFPPVILGHEFVGRVVDEGASVKGKTSLQARYAVLGATAVTCGKCEYCKSGYFMFCPERRGMGHGVNGAFARYAKVRPDQLYRLPDALETVEGAMVEPLAAAVAAVTENTVIRSGDRAMITGPGPIGLLCLQVLVHLGVPTLVVGTAADHERLLLAKALGAAETMLVPDDLERDKVMAFTNGRGVDVAFEVSGAASAVKTCLQSLRPLGSYTQVGHFGREIQLPIDLVAFKQLRVQGSVGYSFNAWRRTLELMNQGLQPSRIVTHTFPLDQWEEGFDLFEQKKAVKVILKPHAESSI